MMNIFNNNNKKVIYFNEENNKKILKIAYQNNVMFRFKY